MTMKIFSSLKRLANLGLAKFEKGSSEQVFFTRHRIRALATIDGDASVHAAQEMVIPIFRVLLKEPLFFLIFLHMFKALECLVFSLLQSCKT
ncbi:hypothetical protein RIF29_39615 [Crotalaria pallida]|uniref:Uncharacterized protein n=1 Tax=Crotalaria pallida TaxID=3830 RepID=A0AAN9E1I1_CROPI